MVLTDAQLRRRVRFSDSPPPSEHEVAARCQVCGGLVVGINRADLAYSKSLHRERHRYSGGDEVAS